jgi:thioesterase domain-containing protein/acyl carrier protein
MFRTTVSEPEDRAASDLCGRVGDSAPAAIQPKLPLLAELIAAAERVLHTAPIRPDDDFFDLGCDSVTALAIAMEAETLSGQSVSLTTIYDAPSAAALAALLSSLPLQVPALVLLKPGDPDLAPVFLVPGIGSTVMQLAEMARGLPMANRVYGLEPQGLAGDRAPHHRIEDMAAFYAAEIRALWPGGSCHLVGYCYGGVIALELARTLSPAGSLAPRATLTLINTFPHSRYWPTASRAMAWLRLLGLISPRSLARRLFGHHLPAMRAMPWPKAAAYGLRIGVRGATLPLRIFGLSAYVRDDGAAADSSEAPQSRTVDMPASLQRVRAASALAFQAYRPETYAGPSLLVACVAARRLPFNPTAYWQRRLPGLSVQTIQCDPPGLLADHLRDLTGIVATFLSAHRLPPAG